MIDVGLLGEPGTIERRDAVEQALRSAHRERMRTVPGAPADEDARRYEDSVIERAFRYIDGDGQPGFLHSHGEGEVRACPTCDTAAVLRVVGREALWLR